MRRALLLAALVLLAGCGQSTDPKKQAEDLGSVAAEGALLAHEAAEGDTREAFAQEHAKALRRVLGELRPALDDPRLATLADDVDGELAALERSPGDRDRAAAAERELESSAKTADELSR